MKKIFTLVAVFAAMFASGQTLNIYYNGTQISHNQTVDISVDGNREHKSYFDIQNTSTDTAWIQILKEEISMVEGSENTYCFGECYEGPQSSIWPIAGGTTLSHENGDPIYFYTNYTPSATAGTSTIKYSIVNTRDANDKVSFTVNYAYGLHVHDKAGIASFNAYPNPAENQVTIKYTLKDSPSEMLNLVVKNIMGQTILSRPVNGKAESIQLDVSALPSGLYLYSLEADCAVLLTKKLYIK